MKILTVIPARGGSKGIPRKNIRLMKNKPLISYSIQTAINSNYDMDVVVSTDDDEIARIAEIYGAKIIYRTPELSTDIVTLDPVIYDALIQMENNINTKYDIVITMQPTSPLLTTNTLDNAIQQFIEGNCDTLLSAINKPHLAWTEKNGKNIPLYSKRLNRQYLPKNLVETGAFFISKRYCVNETSRFGEKVSVFEIPEKEAIDIDTAQDWWIAEKELNKKNIIIRVEGHTEIGLGHIYRCILLAHNLIEHNIIFILSEQSDVGILKIRESNYPFEIIKDNYEIISLINKYSCDILINDVLDTNLEYMELIKSQNIRIVNFEDLGEGAKLADVVINDLYDKKHELQNHYWGSDYYCIRDEFLIAKPSKFNKKVKEILIIFGGTDPSNLTSRLFSIVQSLKNKNIHFTFILGIGYKRGAFLKEKVKTDNLNISIVQDVKLMSTYMSKADIAISSQGRTMLELASMKVPTILIAQNKRELHHEFGYLKNGFINLGLGNAVDDETIKETIKWLIKSPQIREQMITQMNKKNLKNGITKVKEIILNSN